MAKLKNGTKVKTFEVAETTGWDLICHVCLWSYTIVSISEAERDILYRMVYGCNDGYGPVGFVPPQGYDWSGIRNSSEKALLEMERVIRRYFESRKVRYYVVEDRSTS